ncbi:MAG: S8 family serine peptidase [Cyanobacteria bacterium REEB65]|nr:S8 family serine peptidase [Cyanobacteria bacterium REEB65]
MVFPHKSMAACGLLVAGCAALLPVTPAPYPGRAQEIVLRFQGGVSAASQNALAARFGATVKTGSLPAAARWTLPVGTDPVPVVQQLQQNPAIKFAEPNYLRHVLGTPGYSAPEYDANQQWNLEQIKAPEAWQQYFSADHPPGKGVLVAVIDSGVDVRHPDLAPNIAKDASGNVRFLDEVHPTPDATMDIDDQGRNFDWDTAYQDANHPGPDGHGHGTHVAGIIAAAAGDGGYGGVDLVGVAPAATILPVKAMHCDGGGDDWTISNAIVDAANDGAKIENLSIGGPDPSQLLEDSLTYARNKNVLVVIAAGNAPPDGAPVYYPAAYPGMVAVGAVDRNDVYQSYSNFGPQLALVAPGGTVDESTGGVFSTLPTYGSELASEVGATIPGFGRVSGTSQAAPHVAGVAALLWSLDPDLTADQVRDRLLVSADKIPGANSDQQGWGRVNALNALAVGDPRYGQ